MRDKLSNRIALIAACFAFSSLLFANPAQAVGHSINDLEQIVSDRKSEIAELEAKIEKHKQVIKQKQEEAQTLKSQLSILQNRIDRVELEIQATEIEIETNKNELVITALSIENKEITISENKKWLAGLLRAIRRADNTNLIEVVLSDETFSTLIKSSQQLSEIQNHIGTSLTSLVKVRGELLEKKQEQIDQKAELEKLSDKLAHKRDELKGEESNKTLLIAQTKSSEKKYKSLVSDLKQKAKQIENEIFDIERSIRNKLIQDGTLDESGDFFLTWPVPSRYVTSPFHDPDYPYRHIFEHSGTDIRAGQGTAINAAASGYVARARDNGLGYSYVLLIHSQGFATLYGHVSKIYVKKGEFVGQGDIIALSGGTPGTRGAGPFVTGPHLHFEVRKDGIPLNAEHFLP